MQHWGPSSEVFNLILILMKNTPITKLIARFDMTYVLPLFLGT